MTSIREVAQMAGVSPATVSRVINGTAKVDEEKRQRVEKVIRETGFRPNEVARSLFKKSSRIIGMVIPNIENPFINEIAKAVEAEAYRKGYRVTLCNSEEDSRKELESIQMLERMNADGIILMTNSDEQGKNLGGFQIPIVTIDRKGSEDHAIACLQADHYTGGKIAAEYLVKCGCKKIVNMRGLQKYSSARERFAGYMDICKKYNLKPEYVECEYNFEDGFRKSVELLKKYPDVDGVVAANDMVAISLYKVLTKKGYRVPQDGQIIGFDNINLSWLFTPELTTVAQPIKEMGKTAARIIIQNVEGKKVKKEHIFQVKLVERDTTVLRTYE